MDPPHGVYGDMYGLDETNNIFSDTNHPEISAIGKSHDDHRATLLRRNKRADSAASLR